MLNNTYTSIPQYVIVLTSMNNNREINIQYPSVEFEILFKKFETLKSFFFSQNEMIFFSWYYYAN